MRRLAAWPVAARTVSARRLGGRECLGIRSEKREQPLIGVAPFRSSKR